VSGELSPKSPATVPAGFGPLGIGVTSDGKSAYAVNSEEGSGTTISQYDINLPSGELSPKSPAMVPAGTGPTSIALSPDDRSAYVTNFQTNSNHVSQYDIGAGGKLSPKSPPTVTAGDGPVNVAVSPLPRGPTNKAQCRHGGWRKFGFKNQGQCIRFVKRGAKT
jgi:6-phosphogluconolactonase